jgi:RNA polymerase sigma-70 factor (ECF subfamily)
VEDLAGGVPRQTEDPEDVVQSALKSFFLRQADGQFQLDGWDNLWSLLVQITVRKCGRRVRYFRRECRDVQREQPHGPAGNDSGPEWEAAATEPTPVEAATLGELVEQVMSQLDEGERRMLMLSLQGYSAAEVSAAVGRSERTVFRLLRWVREFLQDM